MQHVNGQKLYRSKDRILGGVCAGLAEGFHIDPLWMRIAFVVLIFIQGVGLFVYVVLWLVMPERLEDGGQRNGFNAMTADLTRIWGEIQHQLGGTSRPVPSPVAAPPSAATTPIRDPAQPAPTPGAPAPPSHAVWQSPSQLFGVVVVAIGLLLFGSNIGIINWGVVWPAALITLGIVILVRNLEARP